jgi:hypothetical protein
MSVKERGVCMKAFIERANVKNKNWFHIIRRISFMIIFVFILTGVSSMNACGFFDSASWKEEVLLHDGSKIIVKRWEKLGGPHKLDQRPLIQEYSISFKLPGTNKTILWKDGPTGDIQRANFDPVALHIKNNTPYLITKTYGCLAYNKWGRPNPPYVIFKFEGIEWKRIQLSELPPELKDINLVINTTEITDENILVRPSLFTAEKIKELNKGLTQEIYKTIVRTPFKQVGDGGCSEMVYDGSRWFDLTIYKRQISYDACLKLCRYDRIKVEYCPCRRLFDKNVKGE